MCPGTFNQLFWYSLAAHCWYSDARHLTLELKLVLKRYGPDEESAEARRLLAQVELELAELEAIARPDAGQKKKLNALKRDGKVLQERIDGLARLADQVGGVIVEAEARALILRKHHDLVAEQLDRYLGAEKRRLLWVFDSLWEKYAAPCATLESKREDILRQLDESLRQLRYLGEAHADQIS